MWNNNRIQESTLKITEAQSELQAERRRNAVLEKQLGKAKLDRAQSGTIESMLKSFLSDQLPLLSYLSCLLCPLYYCYHILPIYFTKVHLK